MCISVSPCLLKHILLDCIKKSCRNSFKFIEVTLYLLTIITTAEDALAVLNISGSNLNTNRDSSHLLFRELPARSLVGIIYLNPDSCLTQSLLELIGLIKYSLLLLLDGNNHNLSRCNLRRQHKTGIVTVNHDHGTDKSGCCTPGGLVNILKSIVFIRELNTEGLSKAITEVVACT